MAQLNLGQASRARRSLTDALQTAHELGLLPLLLQAVAGMARYYHRRDEGRRSAELLGFVARHIALPTEVKALCVKPLQAQLEAALGPAELETAPARGQGLALETVVREMLAGAVDFRALLNTGGETHGAASLLRLAAPSALPSFEY